MSTKTALVLVAGFIAGCGAAALAPLVIPPANAQTTTRWETYCVARSGRPYNAEAFAAEVTEIGNRAGREGWEPFGMSHGEVDYNGTICFKRPAQ